MNQPSSILVGLDFDASGALSEGSAQAAQAALWLAEGCGARVDFLHSTHRSAEHGHENTSGDVESRRAAVRALRTGEVECSELVEAEERAALALTRRVLAGKNDLVVVAKRNQSKRADRKLGSVSLDLIRVCPCPVWVIKPGQKMRHESVLAATDLTPVGDAATEYGALIAKAEGCALYVVHAWQLPLDLQMSHSRISEEEFNARQKELRESARAHIKAVPGVAALGAHVKILLAREVPSRVILEAEREVQPDLAVLGTVSRGGIAGFFVGNTAEKLLRELDCSLLTVKPADFICPVH